MTTRVLHLAKDLTLPLDAATESFAILGRRGSGKTHTAVVVAEELLKAGVQVVVIDPLDVWWGLRVSKDGKTAGFPIYVAGGSHLDIPLSADAGKVLADAVVDQGLSIILSTRHLSKTDQRRFVGEFCERLYDRKADPQHRTALHVFIDEADAFVPQRLMPGAERCFGAVDTMVRRGRSSGLAVTLISQRPQVINKDVLSQTEVLVSHQLTGPQDRKALQAWIEANDDENRSAEFMGALASLPKGRAWFWSPGLLKVFRPVDVRDRTTFDSSATPKPGVVGVKPKAFAAVDLHKLTAEIAATIEKAKADDPRELRKALAAKDQRIKELEKVTSGFATSNEGKKQEVKRVEVLTDADRALLEKIAALLLDRAAAAREMISIADRRLDEAVQHAAAEYLNVVRKVGMDAALNVEQTLERVGFQKILAKLSAISSQPSPTYPTPHAQGSRTTQAASQGRRVAPAAATSRPASLPPSGEKLGGAEQRVLDALAELEALGVREPERVQVAFFAGYTNLNSKGLVNALGALRSSGRIEYPTQGRVVLSDAGRADASPAAAPRTPAEVRNRIVQMLGGASARLLDPLIQAYPKSLTREDLAAAANYGNLNSKGFVNAIGRLRSLGFIDYPDRGHVAAQPVLFLEN